MNNKLIYLLNQYSEDSDQHFYHIINLLNTIADMGVYIVLIIEKCHGPIPKVHSNIKVVCQSRRNRLTRAVELISLLIKYIRLGYNRIFIRITINAAIISIIVGKVYGAHIYYWQSGKTYEIDSNQKLLRNIIWKYTRNPKDTFVYRHIDYFVTGPESMISYYENVVKIKHDKMMLLYNDIDISRFHKATTEEKLAIREELRLDRDEIVIIMVHRLSPVRKTGLYIPYVFDHLMTRNLKFHVLIIGDGPDRRHLENLVAASSFKDNVSFLGALPNREIHKYYMCADVFINPSYTEGFPRVVIEAMACGLPIVATDAGGTLDIVGLKQRRYIVDRTRVEDFTSCLEMLICNVNDMAELSDENIEYVQRYSTKSVANMYIEKILQ